MSEFTITFIAPPDAAEQMPDGSTVIFGAEITSPSRWSGQVRDLIIWADGSIHLGADQTRLVESRGGGVRRRLADLLLWIAALPILFIFGGPGVGGNPDNTPPPPPPRDRG